MTGVTADMISVRPTMTRASLSDVYDTPPTRAAAGPPLLGHPSPHGPQHYVIVSLLSCINCLKYHILNVKGHNDFEDFELFVDYTLIICLSILTHC